VNVFIKKIHTENIFKMDKVSLNTLYPTEVYSDYLVDPSIMDSIFEDTEEKRKVVYYGYTDTNRHTDFIKDISSQFLNMNDHKHNPDIWYMDVIRYNLQEEEKRVKSGLAWHVENDNYPNVITVLMYLRLDEGIIDGNLRYKDKENVKKVLEIKSGTTVIMDGNVPHKPQDPYGTGKRDLVIISFKKD
tara:strand:- start:714 stop:1277 length:564 start_codon:yes stop_codon:yes gene_type:complete